MNALDIRPFLIVQAKADDEDEWTDQREYHIATDNAHENNIYIGSQISYMLSCVVEHKKFSWRLVYRESKTVKTTAGRMDLGTTESVVSQVSKYDQHVEEFRDRNDDGYLELNQGLPIYEQFPRFYTEHDIPVAKAADPDVIKVGDYVKVADPAYCADDGPDDREGYVDEVFFGQVCKVIEVGTPYGNILVEDPETEDTNVIHPDFLTKVNKDGSPIEKDEKGDEEFKAGEEVEDDEDEPDDTVHVSDGDVITVYDEYGHEQKLRISVV